MISTHFCGVIYLFTLSLCCSLVSAYEKFILSVCCWREEEELHRLNQRLYHFNPHCCTHFTLLVFHCPLQKVVHAKSFIPRWEDYASVRYIYPLSSVGSLHFGDVVNCFDPHQCYFCIYNITLVLFGYLENITIAGFSRAWPMKTVPIEEALIL